MFISIENRTVKQLSNSLFNFCVVQMSERCQAVHSSHNGHIRVWSPDLLQIKSLSRKIHTEN